VSASGATVMAKTPSLAAAAEASTRRAKADVIAGWSGG